MSLLQADSIGIQLNGLEILSDISLKVMPKSIACIIGPSGCGKSTLFQILSGLLKPDKGKVLIDNADYTHQPGHIGYLQQKDGLFPWKTVLSNVMLPLIIKKKPFEESKKIASQILREFHLESFAHYYPSELSGGMRQRVALLRTYLAQNQILLLDEPFASIDAITRKKMQVWLLYVQQKLQLTILMITHDIEEAIFLSDQIIVFSALPARIVKKHEIAHAQQRTLRDTSSTWFGQWKETIMEELHLLSKT